jgi:hypothetical protein
VAAQEKAGAGHEEFLASLTAQVAELTSTLKPFQLLTALSQVP